MEGFFFPLHHLHVYRENIHTLISKQIHNSLSMQRTFPLRERMRERGREREQERMVTLAWPLMRWKTPENLFLLHTQRSLNYITLCQHDSDEEIVECVCVMWETDKLFFHNNIGDCRWLRLLSMWNRDQWAISVYVYVCVFVREDSAVNVFLYST